MVINEVYFVFEKMVPSLVAESNFVKFFVHELVFDEIQRLLGRNVAVNDLL